MRKGREGVYSPGGELEVEVEVEVGCISSVYYFGWLVEVFILGGLSWRKWGSGGDSEWEGWMGEWDDIAKLSDEGEKG